MLKNAYLDAKIGFDPAENEPPKECCVVAAREQWHALVLAVTAVAEVLEGLQIAPLLPS